MDRCDPRDRFTFLAEALDGVGGFAPRVTWEYQTVTSTAQDGSTLYSTRRVPRLSAPCHLVPYPRESDDKFAARAAVATYENHLREACERFVGYLGRRLPARAGTDAPLVQLMLADADMRGNPLDLCLAAFALDAKARGSMLLLIDMPRMASDDDAPRTLADQIARRAVPYLRPLLPEEVAGYEVNDETGLFERVTVCCTEEVDGKPQACTRTWDTQGWTLRLGDKIIDAGSHPFGQCPVLAFTESGRPYPQVGKYAQIADLSFRLYNARSELDEILRSQTFSLLTLQVPPESASLFDPARVSATIGTHSILTHQGDQPAFIAPDAGPAETYLKVIDQLQASIRRVAMEDSSPSSDRSSVAAESGIARRLRFERLNADLASFAHKLQSLEQRMWALFHRALGTTNRVTVEWPTDFNLVDTAAELDILLAMQATGFPPLALAAKRAAIVAAEFDACDDATKNALLAAVNEQAQEVHTGTAGGA